MTRAFENTRILDFSQVLAGPFATQQLALLGADVIKIEPLRGEGGRHIRSATEPTPKGMSSIFLSVNCAKRSMTLDLKHPRARETLERLIQQADVLVQNYKAGVMARLGFGYEQVRAINSSLIYCSISGYGQSGPRADAAAYDPAIQGASGMMYMVGTDHTGPLRTGYSLVDMSTGLAAALAISGALHRRQITGEGQHLDVSMLDTAMSLISPFLSMYQQTGEEPELLGNQSQLRTPTADVFATANGYLQITALTDEQCKALAIAIGLPELAEDARYTTIEARTEHRVDIRATIERALGSDSAAAWESKLAAAKVPASVVNRFPDALAQEQLQHRDFLRQLDPPPGFDAPITGFNGPYDANVDGPNISRSPPVLGQHTDEILAEFGFSTDEISSLRDGGAIG